MAGRIGVLNTARKIKRIYVGVDGKAHRVSTIYTTNLSGSRARTVYSDTEPLQIHCTFALGNLQGNVYYSAQQTNNSYNIVGTFKNKYVLSEINVSASGLAVTDTGRSVSLGAATEPYINGSWLGVTRYRFLFSGAYSGKVYFKPIDVRDMVVDNEYGETEPVAPMVIDTKNTSISNGPQGFNSLQDPNWAVWPLTYGLVVCAAGNDTFVTTEFSTGTTNSFTGYTISQQSVRSFWGEEYGKKLLAVNSSTGKTPQVLTIASYFNTVSGVFMYTRVYDTYSISMPTNYSATNIYLGAAIDTVDCYDSSITSETNPYVNGSSYVTTMSYQDDTKRYGKLIVDVGKYPTDGRPVSSVTEYTESAPLSSDSSRAQYQNWYLLGYSPNQAALETDKFSHIYVLSTLEDKVKILVFTTSAEGIKKVTEYDTGITLSSDIVLQKVTPVQLTYSPVSLLFVKNNQYNELVIIPKELILQGVTNE